MVSQIRKLETPRALGRLSAMVTQETMVVEVTVIAEVMSSDLVLKIFGRNI